MWARGDEPPEHDYSKECNDVQASNFEDVHATVELAWKLGVATDIAALFEDALATVELAWKLKVAADIATLIEDALANVNFDGTVP